MPQILPITQYSKWRCQLSNDKYKILGLASKDPILEQELERQQRLIRSLADFYDHGERGRTLRASLAYPISRMGKKGRPLSKFTKR